MPIKISLRAEGVEIVGDVSGTLNLFPLNGKTLALRALFVNEVKSSRLCLRNAVIVQMKLSGEEMSGNAQQIDLTAWSDDKFRVADNRSGM